MRFLSIKSNLITQVAFFKDESLKENAESFILRAHDHGLLSHLVVCPTSQTHTLLWEGTVCPDLLFGAHQPGLSHLAQIMPWTPNARTDGRTDGRPT